MKRIYKLIYNLGVKYRNPSLWKYYKFLLESDRWTLDELSRYQLEKTKELMIFAYENSPFYKKEFDSVGFSPYNMHSLDDMKILPIIDKSTLLQHKNEIQSSYRFKKVHYVETSGTSGQVLGFYRNEEWDSQNRASLFRGYHWYGVNPWDRNGYFWGYNIAPQKRRVTRFLDALQNRFRIFTYDNDEIKKFVNKLQKADYVEGYSSMIYEVAKTINSLDLSRKLSLKMVKGTSEKIYEKYQEEAKLAFGKKIVSEYGSCESGMIAYECPEGGHMHIAMEKVVVEEIDGAIVVTNLLSKSFPIIRYKLGDAIKLAPNDYRCPCGRAHPVILDVLGRVGKSIIGRDHKYPSLTFYYVFKNLALVKGINLNYQAVQNEPGKVTLRIEQNRPELKDDLKIELEKYFKKDLEIVIQWGESLHSMNGKMKDFITTID